MLKPYGEFNVGQGWQEMWKQIPDLSSVEG